jgi:type II secretory pathway pseudopilin PulG
MIGVLSSMLLPSFIQEKRAGERIHEDAVMRRADLAQLEQIASGYPSRERFLTELTLDPLKPRAIKQGRRILMRII